MNETIIPAEIYKKYVPDVEFRLIPANQLNSNVEYQRSLSERFVNRVANDFDINLAKVIRVSERDGQLIVFDGQHTVQTICKVSGYPNIPVWCEVYQGLTYEDEAMLFARQQQYEQIISAYQKTHAKIEAQDPVALRVKRLLGKYDFSMSEHLKDDSISATDTLEKLYSTYGEEALEIAIELIRITWKGRKDYLRASVIRGLTKFIYIADVRFDREYFVINFGTVTYNELKLEAKNGPGKPDYSRGIANIYNKKRSKKILVDG